MAAPKATDPLGRFWAKVATRGPDDCWLWMGVCASNGYGQLAAGIRTTKTKKMLSAHRLSWEIENGYEPPAHLYVCHRCDCPPCVNPRHLFLGTAMDNKADEMKKGRTARGERSGARLHPERIARGERCATAKLTEKQVMEIRNLKLSSRLTALRYGISKTNIKDIRRGRIWRHLPLVPR